MISIIIRNKDESDFIGHAIQSCVDNFKDPEIIIVDDNSQDDSDRVISLFDNTNIRIYSLPKKYSPGYSLNYGVSKCNNNTILVLSAHCQLTNLEGWEKRIKTQLNNYCAVFGKQTPIYRGKKITPRYIWSHFGDTQEKNLFSKIEQRYFLHNAFCFYNKEFLKNNPFDENLHGKEDRYWAIDMVKQGHNYLYDPKLKCNHFWTPRGATWKGIG